MKPIIFLGPDDRGLPARVHYGDGTYVTHEAPQSAAAVVRCLIAKRRAERLAARFRAEDREAQEMAKKFLHGNLGFAGQYVERILLRTYTEGLA